ncbi:hypothetical protein HMI54_001885 [Coelomomyces lativittatus]|nr:hypothetical protein HMI56_001493 [Coelomomyces lativittatus]KAJ1518233.1 hypothetical protein HMI54_001885 [Coelomomyces lativittatus]KAJ1518347.1 hypothetical protein HMI55_006550 [Coelomomyces lativittatus]
MPPVLHCIDASLSECSSCQTQYLTNSLALPKCGPCAGHAPSPSSSSASPLTTTPNHTSWVLPPPTYPTYATKNKHNERTIELTPLLHHHRYATLPSEITLELGFIDVAFVPYLAWKQQQQQQLISSSSSSSSSSSTSTFLNSETQWTSMIMVMGPHFLHLLAMDPPHDMRYDLDLSMYILINPSPTTSLHQFALLPMDMSSLSFNEHPNKNETEMTTTHLTVLATTNAHARCVWEHHLSKHGYVPSIDTHVHHVQLHLPSSLLIPVPSTLVQFPSRGLHHAALMDLLTGPHSPSTSLQKKDHDEGTVNSASTAHSPSPWGSSLTSVMNTLLEVYPELTVGRSYPTTTITSTTPLQHLSSSNT